MHIIHLPSQMTITIHFKEKAALQSSNISFVDFVEKLVF
jgi:hypothetical protein